MVGSASDALDGAGLEHWFFGGWAVDLWVGRLTRPHEDIDVLVWRRDEGRIHEVLQEAGWVHTPTPQDLVGTNYARDGYELQLTFVVPVPEEVSSCQSPSNRSCSRAGRWPSHAGMWMTCR